MAEEQDESLAREAYEESNALGHCQTCGRLLAEHSPPKVSMTYVS